MNHTNQIPATSSTRKQTLRRDNTVVLKEERTQRGGIALTKTLAVGFLFALSLCIANPAVHAREPLPGTRDARIQTTYSSVSFLDAMYDFQVWSADISDLPVDFIIWARRADGQWTEVHRYDWSGSVDHGSWTDFGIYLFSTHWNAVQYAETLLQDEEITAYLIEERQRKPHWILLETFDTQMQAQEFCEDAVSIATRFGLTIETRIVPISTLTAGPLTQLNR